MSIARQHKIKLTSISLALAAILLSASEAFSCSCADPSVREKFRAADWVFTGTLIELNSMNPNDDFPLAANLVKFKVEKQWKGPKKSEITAIANIDQPGFCGDLKLTLGERYLIYAEQRKRQLLVETDCGPNRNFKYAAEEISRLNGFWFRLFARLYPYPTL